MDKVKFVPKSDSKTGSELQKIIALLKFTQKV